MLMIRLYTSWRSILTFIYMCSYNLEPMCICVWPANMGGFGNGSKGFIFGMGWNELCNFRVFSHFNIIHHHWVVVGNEQEHAISYLGVKVAGKWFFQRSNGVVFTDNNCKMGWEGIFKRKYFVYESYRVGKLLTDWFGWMKASCNIFSFLFFSSWELAIVC